jgi:dihydropteroate synthase
MKISLGAHTLDCTDRPAIMGILNVGTDSPVAHSVVPVDQAVARAHALHEAGAAIIDIGAHSTRSGGEAPTPQEEIERLCPTIEALVREGHLVSVDTWTPAVAQAAAESGAHILNDVTGATDPAMIQVAAAHQLPLIVMHMRGRPKQHRDTDQRYDDVAAEVRDYLAERIQTLTQAGVPDVWIDPGFEFAKSLDDNLRMLIDLPSLVDLGHPVVISASRKGFLAELLGHGALRSSQAQAAPGILEATLAFNTLAAYFGTHILRVHDVQEIERVLHVVQGVRTTARSIHSS